MYTENRRSHRAGSRSFRVSARVFLHLFSYVPSESDPYDLHFQLVIADIGGKAELTADGRVFQIMSPPGHISSAYDPQADVPRRRLVFTPETAKYTPTFLIFGPCVLFLHASAPLFGSPCQASVRRFLSAPSGSQQGSSPASARYGCHIKGSICIRRRMRARRSFEGRLPPLDISNHFR